MNNLFSLHSALSADIADEVRASSFTKFWFSFYYKLLTG